MVAGGARLIRSSRGVVRCVLLAASLASPAAQAQAPAFDTVTRGCYRLLLGDWSHPSRSGMPSLHIPPEVVRFDTTEATFPRTRSLRRYRIHPNIPAIEASRRPWDPAWVPRGADSVQVNWTTGFVGVQLDLAVRGDSLFGIATARYDVAGLLPRASVLGWRVECPLNLAPQRDE